MKVVAGIDIGGTKCAISFAGIGEEKIVILDKVRMETDVECFDTAMQKFILAIRSSLKKHEQWKLMAIGISCGVPLDAKKGLILSPPYLS